MKKLIFLVLIGINFTCNAQEHFMDAVIVQMRAIENRPVQQINPDIYKPTREWINTSTLITYPNSLNPYVLYTPNSNPLIYTPNTSSGYNNPLLNQYNYINPIIVPVIIVPITPVSNLKRNDLTDGCR